MYTLARFWPPVWVCLLVLSARDATFATPRSNDRRRRVLAVLPSMFARPARSSYAIVDALDLGAPTAPAGDTGAHSSLGLGGRRPSRGALRASRRNGRGVVSPKTGRTVNGVQERVGKPRVIVVQDGQGGSQAAAGWLAVYRCWCRCWCRVGRWYQIKITGWMARLRVVTRSTACRQKRRTAAAPGQAQLRKSDRQSLARRARKEGVAAAPAVATLNWRR